MKSSTAGEADLTQVPVCATCGASPSGGPAVATARLTWSRGVERGRPTWTCVTCTRTYLRGIEGKLDSDWW